MTDEIHQLAGAYATDALTADERALFEAHLETCATCTAEVADHRSTLAELADAEKVAPPAHLRASVLAEIATTPQSEPLREPAKVIDISERRRNRVRQLALAAAVVLIAGLATFGLLRDGTSDMDELAARADAVITQLEGDPGSITVVWSPESDRVGIIGEDLPDPGAERTYELWLVDAEGVNPTGLFRPRSGLVEIVLPVDDLDAQGWGVTIEPAGGSDQPTSEIIYIGEI